eukprot:Clim_evm30s198 gene=Clim_evmTU30s198
MARKSGKRAAREGEAGSPQTSNIAADRAIALHADICKEALEAFLATESAKISLRDAWQQTESTGVRSTGTSPLRLITQSPARTPLRPQQVKSSIPRTSSPVKTAGVAGGPVVNLQEMTTEELLVLKRDTEMELMWSQQALDSRITFLRWRGQQSQV